MVTISCEAATAPVACLVRWAKIECWASRGDDRLLGATGNDFLAGGLGFDRIIGGVGDDVILVGGFNDFLSGGGGNDQMFGGPSSDRLFGNFGDDILQGDAGSDIIEGRAGQDDMEGGDGVDRFIYFGISETGVGARDRILDFASAGFEKIDLRFMDANINTVEDDAFTFVNAFTGIAGQALIEVEGLGFVLAMEVTGDGVRDGEIFVAGSALEVSNVFA
jgi:Ca2+-binding RTX toxin-like protein